MTRPLRFLSLPPAFLLVFSLAGAIGAHAETVAPSSVGPSWPGESKLLWTEGNKAFDLQNYGAAARHFQRLIDRYPSTHGYLKAQQLLGLSYVRAGQFRRAIQPLKNFIEATPSPPESHLARVNLGRAYLGVGDPHAALLAASEVERHHAAQALPTPLHLEALLVKARAHLGLNDDAKAALTLAAFKKETATPTYPMLRGDGFELELQLKTRACRKLPENLTLKEDETLAQLSLLGTCLMETLPVFEATLRNGDARWADRSSTLLQKEFARLWGRDGLCFHPPTPPGVKGQALKRYRVELVERLKTDCGASHQKALELLDSWRQTLKPESREPLNQLSASLRGTRLAPPSKPAQPKTVLKQGGSSPEGRGGARSGNRGPDDVHSSQSRTGGEDPGKPSSH